jgi:peptidoglycan biosynthesis protein MviN/MurJ (putative lipid II flippase)
MFPLKQGGLALATAISGLMNNVILLWLFNKNVFKFSLKGLIKPICKAFAAALIALNCYWIFCKFDFLGSGQIERFIVLIAEGIVFGIIYLGVSFMVKNHELSELVNLLLKRKKS